MRRMQILGAIAIAFCVVMLGFDIFALLTGWADH